MSEYTEADYSRMRDGLTRIGMTLVMMQHAERTIDSALKLALQDNGGVDVLKKNKRTLGQLLNILRQRADLADDFEATLQDFLSRRNTLAHNLDDIPDFDLKSVGGHTAIAEFTSRTLEITEYVTHVFIGLLRAWHDQVGWDMQVDGQEAAFEEIDRIYKPLVDQIFFAKE